jgi:glutaredoxin-like protein NrdH
MSVVVYSKPSCVQCTATYRTLDKLGVAYDVIDMTTDPEALAFVMSSGQKSAPVVVVTEPGVVDQVWGGFRPDLIADLAKQTVLAAA